jgi:hypothetical protein
MVKPAKREMKMPYSKPTLTVYGTVRELTQQIGHSGKGDGQKNPLKPNKTHI